METDRPGESSEEFSVRLSWPKAGAAPAEAPERPAADVPDAPARPAPSSPPTFTARTVLPRPTPPPSSPSPGGEQSRLSAPTPATTSVAAPVPDVASMGGDTRMGRVFVEAFDRLADRLLERLRSLRQDVDADLASVRSELQSLRQAVEDVGDRVQLRQLRATLDELRSDVVGLRRAVLEWPELEQVSADIAAVRGDLSFLFESTADGTAPAAPSELLGELQHVVANLSDEVTRLATDQPQMGALAPLMEEVAGLRGELTQIRRRMVLRATPIDDEQLERIVEAVAARVVDELSLESRRGKRR
jgi:hypothetical protein